jgi:hypothetical protein
MNILRPATAGLGRSSSKINRPCAAVTKRAVLERRLSTCWHAWSGIPATLTGIGSSECARTRASGGYRMSVMGLKRRNTRCEQMFSAILPTADIRRTERDVRQHFFGLLASSRFERASGHVEAVPLYRDNARMPHGLRDRTSRFRRRRLKLTVGTEGELLSDRGGQNAQSC